MVKLEFYRVFYIVAKTGNLSKASKELFISQPAVSYGIIFMNPQYMALLGLSDRDYVRVGIGVTAFSGVFIALGMYIWNKRKKEEEDRKRDMDSLNSDIKEEEYRYDELEERSMEKMREESSDGCDATVLLSDFAGGRGGKSVPILFGRINGKINIQETNAKTMRDFNSKY